MNAHNWKWKGSGIAPVMTNGLTTSEYMTNAGASKLKCRSATKHRMNVDKDGELTTIVRDAGGNEIHVPIAITASPDVESFILSIHPLFATGDYSFLRRTEARGGRRGRGKGVQGWRL